MIDELYVRDAELVSGYTGSDVTFKIFKHPVGKESWVEDFTLAPSQIVSESMELKQSICDNRELKLGGCIPSQLKLDVMNIGLDSNGNRIDLSGKRIAVIIHLGDDSGDLYPNMALYPSDNLYPNQAGGQQKDYVLFIGQIYSYKKTSNRKISRIIAYDRMFYSTTVLCKQRIYNYLKLHDADYFTVGDLIRQFFPEAGIRIASLSSNRLINYNNLLSIVDLPFDSLVKDSFTYNDFMQLIIELNAAFLVEDTPGENLTHTNAHPRVIAPFKTVDQPKYEISTYSHLQYDDFLAKPIRYFQLPYQGGATYIYKSQLEDLPEYGHYISDNVLTKCTARDEVRTIIRTLDADFNGGTDCILGDVYVYRPFKASIFNRWWVQVGDRIRIPTVNDDEISYVESIVLSRKVKGIRNIKVEIEAKGVETLGKEHDDISNE